MKRNKENKNSQRCFIIAEAGVNHNGSLELAKKMAKIAKTAGADAVKFQTFKSEDLVAKNTPLADYQEKNISRKENQIDMLKRLELSNEEFIKLKNHCDKLGILFLSTPHTEEAVDFLDYLVPVFKVGSGDITNLPMLEKIAKKKKPIIISCGMANLKEIEQALKTLRKFSNKQISLLQCTTNYPCPLNEVNLRAMATLRQKFSKKFCPIEFGYSDHTEGIIVSVSAAALGACVVEKHFTLDKNMPGPDHKASLPPAELKEMIFQIRNIEAALGSGEKKPFASEEKIKKIVRKSIVAKIDIKKGEIIKKSMLIMKRPGTGIEPKNLPEILGRIAKKDIKKDELISRQNI